MAISSGIAPSDFERLFELAPTPMLLLAADAPRFTMLAVNQAHRRAFRTQAMQIVGSGVFEVFPDTPDPMTGEFMESIRLSLTRALASGRPDEMAVQPYGVIGAGGELQTRYWGATHTPLRDGADDPIVQILSTIREVTAEVEARRANEARALLMLEVDHRARNALTVVQSILQLTQAPDIGAFKRVSLGRVEALGRAQTCLTRRRWEGADLRDLLDAELAALAPDEQRRLEGPQVDLPASNVQAMTMLVHELATNAIKYGAWSSGRGRVDVTWRTPEPTSLVLLWRELGGPVVSVPASKGFGTRMVEQLVRQLGGKVRHNWRREGLRVELTAELAHWPAGSRMPLPLS